MRFDCLRTSSTRLSDRLRLHSHCASELPPATRDRDIRQLETWALEDTTLNDAYFTELSNVRDALAGPSGASGSGAGGGTGSGSASAVP